MSEEEVQFFQEDGTRMDGREKSEVRETTMEVGVLDEADGSAMVETGNTRVVASVFGPQELHPKHLQESDRAVIKMRYNMAPFSVDDRMRPGPNRRAKEIGLVAKRALEPAIRLEKFPTAGIDISMEVIESDGGTRVTGINAAALALADAGIPMKGLVSACASGVVDGEVVNDVNGLEDKKGNADVPIAVINGGDEITLLQMDGDLTKQQVDDCISMAKKGCESLYEQQRQTLIETYESIRQ
ncbi:exosome complex exonuclease Rrp41 [Candidatus Nanohalococcus occultus]|uniref:Exosome complex RNA-binding protein Rrp41 n=1 Tax=Candidatus Nanohalococcus occultus TaxID=2978047 RepID=A0ABY8CHV3_9ARCH|nr:Exosome complex RNA-binding protein Rrp41 [Candidatus Nanohaloarchaeota archaeon SVXNc]